MDRPERRLRQSAPAARMRGSFSCLLIVGAIAHACKHRGTLARGTGVSPVLATLDHGNLFNFTHKTESLVPGRIASMGGTPMPPGESFDRLKSRVTPVITVLR